jgi:HD domain
MSNDLADSAIFDMMGGTVDAAWYFSGKVRRFHTTYGIDQTTADHQWGVALFILRHNPTASRALLVAALTHDMPEIGTGDSPGPAKRMWHSLNKALDDAEAAVGKLMGLPEYELTKEEGLWLKLADYFECIQLAHYCVPEPFKLRVDRGKLRRVCHNICLELGITIELPDRSGFLGSSMMSVAFANGFTGTSLT